MFKRLDLIWKYWRRPNASWIILASTLGLLAIGLIELGSVGKTHPTSYYYFKKQVIWLIPSFAAFGLLTLIQLQFARRWAWALTSIALGLLVLTLVFGDTINGARRWLSLGPLNFQSSELAKIALAFILAHHLAENQRRLHTFGHGFLVPCVLTGAFATLTLIQPDFGTAALLGTIGMTLIFLSGAPLRYLIPTAASALCVFCIAIYFNPVRFARITAFLNVDEHKTNTAYQLWQGLLAFGSGGLTGKGLQQGRQQLAYLPEAQTDFILPIIGEELGLIATSAILALYATILITGLIQINKAPNLFEFLLASGALFFISTQALININVTTGLLPTKGIPLPFISYGGSNLLAMFSLTAILLNCIANWQQTPLPKTLPR